MSDAFLRSVAAEFLELVAAKQPATRTIAQRHEVHETTAFGWIRKCRERGFLEPKPYGKRRARRSRPAQASQAVDD